MATRKLTVALLLLALVGTAGATTLKSTFQVDTIGDETATMMHYTYLKEPGLKDNYGVISAPEDTGKTAGMKTGAFNYLVNGQFNFLDEFEYWNGELDGPIPIGTAARDSPYVDHYMDVLFEGEKGISEFYGKGFFPNNRAMSAWKKIRYENVSAYDLGGSYMSPQIDVIAEVWMGDKAQTGASADYDFQYEANVTDAVVEVWDATGWTNKTAGKRIDWEQTALTKGSIHMINDLKGDGLFIPAAGAEDWLPCCSDPLKYVNQEIYYGSNWPNVNQQMIFNCTYPGLPPYAGSRPETADAEVPGDYNLPSSGKQWYVPGGPDAYPTSSKQWYVPGTTYPTYMPT